MPYELISDGKLVPLGDRRYLLSPQDLAGLEVLPDLIKAGVASLKIEGRLKTAEYVANITRLYRQALDRCCDECSQPPAADTARYEMEMAFSRGLSTGWLGGTNNQELVHARSYRVDHVRNFVYGRSLTEFQQKLIELVRDANGNVQIHSAFRIFKKITASIYD